MVVHNNMNIGVAQFTCSMFLVLAVVLGLADVCVCVCVCVTVPVSQSSADLSHLISLLH